MQAVSRRRSVIYRSYYYFLVFVPPLACGYFVAAAWDPQAHNDYFATVSQLIATILLAVAVEYFVGESRPIPASERRLFIVLLSEAWLGLFVCVAALAYAHGTAVRGG